jgi:WhiB family redox-sensing transcriptional regulator
MLAPQILEPELESDEAAVAALDPWARARCRDGNGTLTHLFFSEEPLQIARAKAICSLCTVRGACLDAALDRAEPWGVWGGQLVVNGVVLAHKRPRGRPPKHPHPELVVDEVPSAPRRVARAG